MQLARARALASDRARGVGAGRAGRVPTLWSESEATATGRRTRSARAASAAPPAEAIGEVNDAALGGARVSVLLPACVLEGACRGQARGSRRFLRQVYNCTNYKHVVLQQSCRLHGETVRFFFSFFFFADSFWSIFCLFVISFYFFPRRYAMYEPAMNNLKILWIQIQS